MNWLMSLFSSIGGYFSYLSIKEKGCIVYLEGKQDVPHLLPIINELKTMGENVTIVSSEKLEIDNCIFILEADS